MFCEFVHIAFLSFDYFGDLLKNSCFCPTPHSQPCPCFQFPFMVPKGQRGMKRRRKTPIRGSESPIKDKNVSVYQRTSLKNKNFKNGWTFLRGGLLFRTHTAMVDGMKNEICKTHILGYGVKLAFLGSQTWSVKALNVLNSKRLVIFFPFIYS